MMKQYKKHAGYIQKDFIKHHVVKVNHSFVAKEQSFNKKKSTEIQIN